VATFKAALRRAGKASRTFDRYAIFLRQFIAWLGDREPGAVSAADIADSYLTCWWDAYEGRYGKGPSPNTVRNHYTALNSFFDFLETRDHVASNPIRKLQRERPAGKKKRNDFLRPDEDERLLRATSTPEERIIISLLRFTGMRAGEATAITWGDVDFTTSPDYPAGLIEVRRSKTVAGERILPIFPDLQLELHRWHHYQRCRDVAAANDPVLATKFGTPMTHDFVWRVVKRVAFRANVRRTPCTCATKIAGRHDRTCPRTQNDRHLSEITPHTLRRTFGTALRRQGTPLDAISKALGHSSTKVTEESYVDFEAAHVSREILGHRQNRIRQPGWPVDYRTVEERIAQERKG
jgi:integrase